MYGGVRDASQGGTREVREQIFGPRGVLDSSTVKKGGILPTSPSAAPLVWSKKKATTEGQRKPEYTSPRIGPILKSGSKVREASTG